MANSENQSYGKCRKNINFEKTQAILCDGNCKISYHRSCTGLTVKKYEDIVKSDSVFWFCEPCKKKRENRRSTLINASNVNSPQTTSKEKHLTLNNDISLTDIYFLLETLQKDVSLIKIEMADYKETMAAIINENKTLRNENDALKDRIGNIEYRMDESHQEKFRNNILICGIPETENENVTDILKLITDEINVTLVEEDITDINRMKIKGTNSSGLPTPILVTFSNNKAKNDFMDAKKKKKEIDTRITHKNMKPKHSIYIGDHLTRYRQLLFKEARDAKRKGNVKYAWSKNGEIYIRKTEDGDAIKIRHINQL